MVVNGSGWAITEENTTPTVTYTAETVEQPVHLRLQSRILQLMKAALALFR